LLYEFAGFAGFPDLTEVEIIAFDLVCSGILPNLVATRAFLTESSRLE
jgi:hypothetical protein